MRVCIDEKFFVGLWYTVIGRDVDTQRPIIKRNEDLIDQPDPVVCLIKFKSHGGFLLLKLEEVRKFKNESCHSTQLNEMSKTNTIRVPTSYRTNHKQLHKLSYESHHTSVTYKRTTDEMVTSTMARTMSRRTLSYEASYDKNALSYDKVRQYHKFRTTPSYNSLWRFHRTFTLILRSYDDFV
jgi:hypothetical protein